MLSRFNHAKDLSSRTAFPKERLVHDCAFQGSSEGHLFILLLRNLLCRVGLLVIGGLPVELYLWHFFDALNSLVSCKVFNPNAYALRHFGD